MIEVLECSARVGVRNDIENPRVPDPFNAETKAYIKSAPRNPILPTQRYTFNAKTPSWEYFNAGTKAYVKSAPRNPILPTQRYMFNAETPA